MAQIFEFLQTLDFGAISIQFSLGVVLFFLINWVGKHSFSIGYTEITLFIRDEEAPAVNFLIRVLLYISAKVTTIFRSKLTTPKETLAFFNTL